MLWNLWTTPNRSTGYTPFFIVYDVEAILPSDLIHDAPRVRLYEEREAEQSPSTKSIPDMLEYLDTLLCIVSGGSMLTLPNSSSTII